MSNSQVPAGAEPKLADIITSLDDDKIGTFDSTLISVLTEKEPNPFE